MLDETTLMSGEIEIADHKRHLKRYKACFTGRQAVQWMIASRVAADLPEALAFGAALVKAELVKAGGGHLIYSHLHNYYLSSLVCFNGAVHHQ